MVLRYSQDANSQKTPKGNIDVTQMTKISTHDNDKKHPYSFSIETIYPARVWLLKCCNKEDMIECITQIRTLCSVNKVRLILETKTPMVFENARFDSTAGLEFASIPQLLDISSSKSDNGVRSRMPAFNKVSSRSLTHLDEHTTNQGTLTDMFNETQPLKKIITKLKKKMRQ
eukprot:UN23899